ncbi:acetoacetyl-CoA synthetase-like [Argiope bruennichi]|uniref:acetoacetyl-CoA synthetase-like n=1 Tax=Argiope bruennichi TaxID=94029 RepID=UPI0024953EA8|nr:acetoacetyl-CoA synthetase-like [Argiope bruennichi]
MNNQKLADNALMWKPSKRFGEPMRKFKQVIENKYNINIDDYWDFHKWSIEHLPELWAELWNFAGILYSKKFDKVIDLNIPFDELPVWFEGAKLNLAENLLKYRGDKLAFVIANGAEGKESMTYSQLFEASKLYASAFRKFGLKKGDVVACQMSNRKEAIIAMIAVISIGAIWAGVLSLLGSKAVLSRIRQIQPKVYFTIDRIPHERKHISMLEKIEEISEGLPSLTKVIIVPSNEDVRSKDISTIKNSCFLDEFLQLV